MRTVLVRVNGQLRPVEVRDRSVKTDRRADRRADPNQPGHVPAPVTGIVSLLVSAGDTVTVGDPIATLEAMKMESTITAPRAGTVQRVAATSGTRLEQGDLLLVIESNNRAVSRAVLDRRLQAWPCPAPALQTTRLAPRDPLGQPSPGVAIGQ